MTPFFDIVAVLAVVFATGLCGGLIERPGAGNGGAIASFHSAAAAQADADAWDRFKRIRQGKDPDAVPQAAQRAAQKPDTTVTAEPATADPATVKPAAPKPTASEPVMAEPVTTEPVASSAALQAPPGSASSRAAAAAPAGDRRFLARASAAPVSAPTEPLDGGNWWAFYRGTLDVADKPFYGPYGLDFKWAYALRQPLPDNPRILVSMHGSGAGEGAMRPFGPSSLADIEVRTQDAEAYGQNLREWWTFAPNATPAPGRRIAATLHYLEQRYPFDPDSKGLVLEGPSMGGAGAVVQTMILPDPWRARIAYVSARAGVIMPRQVYAKHPGQYRNFPPDSGRGKWLWDRIDFAVQAAIDPVVRGIHYRHAFSSNDQFSDGHAGSTLLEFVNLVEQHKIGGAFSWVNGGHATSEAGVNIPELWKFEVPEQDVTLDRAHPALTHSSGNYPLSARQRSNEAQFPRGHYNLGIVWDHARIVDDSSQIIFPLKYTRRTGFGKGVPDQPRRITVDVTPRRPRNFQITDGETLRWSWDDGALSGFVTVEGDTVTVQGVPLVSGHGYKNLRIYR